MTLPEDAVTALQAGRKIEAIKRVRQHHNVDLKTAKETVERYIEQHPELALASPSGTSVSGLSTLIAIICICVIVYYFLN
jgi:hypothetical protein